MALRALQWVFGGDLVCWIAGPILDKELRVASRRRRTYVFRTAYLALLGIFMAFAWMSAVSHYSSRTYIASQMAMAGCQIVMVLVWFQFVVMPLVAVVMLSPAISEEIHRRTLGVLLSTPVSSWQLIIGKLSGGLVQIVLLLAVSLPLLAVVRVFGGVPWEYVVAGLSLTLAASVFAGSLSLYFSIGIRHAYAVVLLTLFVVGILYFVLPVLLIYMSRRAEGGPPPGLTAFLVHSNPYMSLGFLTTAMLGQTSLPVMPSGWPTACGVLAGASAILLALAARKVRRVALRELSGESPAIASAPESPLHTGTWDSLAAARIRHISGSPVAWREFRTHLTPSPQAAVCISVVVAAIVFLACVAIPSAEFQDSGFHGFCLTVLVASGLLATVVAAATGITLEKEAGTWPLLLATPLTGREVVLGKAAGVLRRSAPVWSLTAAYTLVFVLLGLVHPIVALHLAIIVAGLFIFVTGSGVLIGVSVRRTTTAVVLNLCLALFLWGAVPLALYFVADTLDLLSYYNRDVHPITQANVILNPLGMVDMVAESASGKSLAQQSLWNLSYAWLGRSPQQTVIETTKLLLLASALYAGAGLYLAALAGVRLRRRIT